MRACVTSSDRTSSFHVSGDADESIFHELHEAKELDDRWEPVSMPKKTLVYPRPRHQCQ
jgi:hypothetical protein